jgi:hypothetical protein
MLMAVLHTLKRRQVDVVRHLTRGLDPHVQDIQQDPGPLLFPADPPSLQDYEAANFCLRPYVYLSMTMPHHESVDRYHETR